ncbi:hypothetical protein BTN49_0823 [Candidatus Enterovibrio escicola]|uniref:Uncharacterized protein n=1 Tax=Candidatus Enterovibrio escicola TaxID=1927127 RepID=A0A2A5T6T5_9GAMM|nr:hypothetical protein BTN49_0823 [Candidatus Enterovibrio escacola]
MTEIITGIKKNIKPKVIKLWDCLILWKPFLIQTVFDN